MRALSDAIFVAKLARVGATTAVLACMKAVFLVPHRSSFFWTDLCSFDCHTECALKASRGETVERVNRGGDNAAPPPSDEITPVRYLILTPHLLLLIISS